VLTLGHVLNNTIQTFLRARRAWTGRKCSGLPGTDHAGIAIRRGGKGTQEGGHIRHRDDLGRDKFLEKVWEWQKKHGGIIIQQLKEAGVLVAIGRANGSRWTRITRGAFRRCLSSFTKRG